MASEFVPIADIKKPEKSKVSPLSKTNVDQPLEHGANAQIEIYSNMGRTRTGIHASKYVWGDRTFGLKHHPNGKPQDTGK
jgi:hypothetical protein